MLVSTAALGLALAGLGCRLGVLHLGPDDSQREDLSRRRTLQKTLLAGRGTIYDASGRENILALNITVSDVCADPRKVVSENAVLDVASHLAETLDLPIDEVAVKVNQEDRRFAYIRRYVHPDVVESVNVTGYPGLFLREQTFRHYPHGSFMCHVLGFVNHENVGSAGVEQCMDHYLRGSPGRQEGPLDGLRRELVARRRTYIPALSGADIVLTLDQNVQYIVERAIDRALQEHQAQGAWAVVQRVRTGEILAMASRPAFDLNHFRHAAVEEKRNRAIGYVYEPGSTFKLVVFTAVLNERLVTPETVIDCENGEWYYGGYPLRDFSSHGCLSVADGLKKSSNILSAKLALRLGEARFHDYLRRFGFGRGLGIDLPGEEDGILHPVPSWSNISATRIAIGQGVAVTALQMLGAACALANDGVLLRPYVVDRVIGPDGQLLHCGKPAALGRTCSPATAALMRRLLFRVTQAGGTGGRACVEGYEVAGKTGTAQKPEAGGYSKEKYVASFVGFLPAHDPEIGVIVVIDEPQPVHTGGRVAAPVFGEIAAQAVRYLNIPPAREQEMLASQCR